MSGTRNIPEHIKREVRRRCGFGCVICGAPIYEYDHMKEWSVVKEHEADDITLLCSNHHTEKTKGLLPTELLRKYDKNPYNIKHGKSASNRLYFYGNYCRFILGGNTFVTENYGYYPSLLVPLVIDGEPLFSFTLFKGELFLNAKIYDKDNNLMLVIKNNHLAYSLGNWDVTFIGSTLTLRQAERDILLKLTFETPNTVIVDRGKLYYNGASVLLHKDKLLVGEKENNQFIGSTVKNLPIGFSIGEQSFDGVRTGVRISLINRHSAYKNK